MCDKERPLNVVTEPVHEVQNVRANTALAGLGERRRFLRFLGLAVVGAITLPYRWAQAKKVGLKLAQVPLIGKVGGSTLVTIKGRDLLLIRDSDKGIFAINPECTHKKCQVAYKAAQRGLACKCHKSAFKLDGTVLSGPAPRPLETFPAELRGDQVVITLPQ
jgi:nitrite reductase/ring-hydroxylating ferredoxin subunit